MAQPTAAPDPFGPFAAPAWATPAARLALGAAVVLPLAANVLFWLGVSAVVWIAGHDVTWAYWSIGGALLGPALATLIAYGRRHAIGLEGIVGSIFLLALATPAWALAVFVALLVLAGGGE